MRQDHDKLPQRETKLQNDYKILFRTNILNILKLSFEYFTANYFNDIS